jgi:hypothetical protein
MIGWLTAITASSKSDSLPQGYTTFPPRWLHNIPWNFVELREFDYYFLSKTKEMAGYLTSVLYQYLLKEKLINYSYNRNLEVVRYCVLRYCVRPNREKMAQTCFFYWEFLFTPPYFLVCPMILSKYSACNLTSKYIHTITSKPYKNLIIFSPLLLIMGEGNKTFKFL